MSNGLHVYRRDEMRTKDSLAVLVEWIPSKSVVLDLGCGAGALGERLAASGKQVQIDGVTLNPREAELAKSYYRRIAVSNLEDGGLDVCNPGQLYDCVVCADVLEHLRDPQRLLSECRALLKPSGQLLISVPNVAYSGLVADLLQGSFKYRDEGLLDKTHLRFFTRDSLIDLLSTSDWGIEKIDAVELPLPASEFAKPIETLPPSVASQLLTMPNALVYQWLVMATDRRSRQVARTPLSFPSAESAKALYTVTLFVGDDTGFTEERKLWRYGEIGVVRQTLTFEISRELQPWKRLRLDLADRPGFFHLHRITLRDSNGVPLWGWDAQFDPVSELLAAPHHQIWPPGDPGRHSASLIFLVGSDPWIELPTASLLDRYPEQFQSGVVLEMDIGWPMSADYFALAHQLLGKRSTERPTEIRSAASPASTSELLRIQNEELIRRRRELAERNHFLELESVRVGKENERLRAHIMWIEDSNVIRWTRPLVHLKMKLTKRSGAQSKRAPHSIEVPAVPLSCMVDIIVPVYRGLRETRRCIESLSQSRCRTEARLIIINDASPEPEVTEWLRQFASQNDHVVLLENPENLGFVGTVNRGLVLSDCNDVVLVNSDAEVANDWLDRLRAAAYRRPRVATVTPFSNNATICSYPRFLEVNQLPDGIQTGQLDRWFAEANAGLAVEVPTGVGFCMYMTRAAIRDVGLLDHDNFGKGYGEENDFCQRAIARDWVNLHALDVFALHDGGVSFGDSKNGRELAAMETMRRLHPGYEAQVHRFIALDPARFSRLRVDLLRIRERGLPVILAVIHDRGGGALKHVRELQKHSEKQGVFLLLAPAPGGQLILSLMGDHEGFTWHFNAATQFNEMLDLLRQVGVQLVHYHHLVGHHDRITELPALLQVPYDFTAHDYYSFCPQITLTDVSNRYCEERGIDQCVSCLKRLPAPGGVSIETWRHDHRHLLENARHVLVPSRDAARRIARFAPGADVRLALHTDMYGIPSTAVKPARKLGADAPLRVVVLGALSAIKGADVLEDVARLAQRESAPLEFHLVGYAYRSLISRPRSALTVHGAYEEQDLPAMLDWLKPDVLWFPAVVPETYSYTLSVCLKLGLPVVAPDLGAFPERLAGRLWSWIKPWKSSSPEWLEFFEMVRTQHFQTGLPPVIPEPISEDAADVLIKDWSYSAEYLVGLKPVTPAHERLSTAALQSLLPENKPILTPASKKAQVKSKVLLIVLRMRSSPLLRRWVRHIPAGWQSRLKMWLRT